MTSYRVAFRGERSSDWQWKSTVLTSLNNVLTFLRVYSVFPKDRTRVFFASRTTLLEQMLTRENAGLLSNSIRADHLLSGKRAINRLEMQRLEAQLLIQENKGDISRDSGPVPSEDFVMALRKSCFSTALPAQESGSGGDHEIPYRFTTADSWPQAFAWIKLLARVRRGELEP